MKKLLRFNCCVFFGMLIMLLGTANILNAATTVTWTGATSTDWSVASNWDVGVPSGTDIIMIPGGLTNYPVVSTTVSGLSGNITINSAGTGASLTITTGGSFTTTGNITIEVGGSFIINDGLAELDGITSDGEVIVDGGTITSTSDISIDAGTLNQTAGIIWMAANTSTTPTDELMISNSTVNQSGGTIATRDFNPTSGAFYQTGPSAVLKIYNDWKPSSGHTFYSTDGTVQFSGGPGGSTTYTSVNVQFHNILVDAGINPAFSGNPNSLIKISGDFTNNYNILSNTTKATFIFNGTGDQFITGISSNNTFGHLVIDKTSGILTLNNAIGMSGNLTMTRGTFDFGTYQLAIAGTFSSFAAGTLNIGALTFASNCSKNPAPSAGTIVNYYASGAQIVSNAFVYSNLSLTGSGNKTFVGATTITSKLSISGTAVALLASSTTSLAISLELGGISQVTGSWGGIASPAIFVDPVWFGSTTSGIVNVVSGCTGGAWLGINNTNWSDGTNWCGGLPTSTTDVIIPSGTPYMAIVDLDPASPAVCNNLTINNGATLQIAPGKALTANGVTTNYGSFIIDSDASGTGSFIDDGTPTGNVTVKKYLSTGRYWYIGAPISNATAVAFGTLSSIPDSGNRLFYWDEATTQSYINVTNTGEVMPALRGYPFKTFLGSPVTASFTGTLNTGTIGGTANLTRTAGGYKEGFNLISNPYPSAINWGSSSTPTPGLTQTNLATTIWYSTNGAFATYNWQAGIGVNGGQRYIPAMQAFWVRVDSGFATGGLELTNYTKIHNSQAFYKTGAETNLFRINISDGFNTDEVAVGFWPDATGNFENYDSEKMFYASVDLPQIYTLSTDGIKTAINGQSEIAANEDRIITLGYSSPVAGTFSLEATNLIDFDPFISVYIEDLQTGLLQDLRQVSTYSFTTGIINNSNRFRLHFGNSITTGITSVSANSANVFAVNNILYVNIPETGSSIIELYDMLGNIILSHKPVQGLNTIQTNVSTGIYLVKVHNSAYAITKKVIITK